MKNNKIFLKKTEKEIESNFALYVSKNDMLKYLTVAPSAGALSGLPRMQPSFYYHTRNTAIYKKVVEKLAIKIHTCTYTYLDRYKDICPRSSEVLHFLTIQM